MTSIASKELREKALHALLDMELPESQVAEIFGVSPRTLRRWMSRYRNTGETAPMPRGHRKTAFSDHDRRRAASLLRHHPNLTLSELQERLETKASIASVCRLRQQVQQGRKKRNAPDGPGRP